MNNNALDALLVNAFAGSGSFCHYYELKILKTGEEPNGYI